jgi:preprotein translocase subunit SecE
MENNKFTEYFKGVKAEWGKITWPERKQVIAQTVIVIVIVIAFTLYTYGADIIFRGILNALNLKA